MIDLEKVCYPRLNTHTDTNTNTVVALTQAGNWSQAGLAVVAGVARWGQANWKYTTVANDNHLNSWISPIKAPPFLRLSPCCLLFWGYLHFGCRLHFGHHLHFGGCLHFWGFYILQSSASTSTTTLAEVRLILGIIFPRTHPKPKKYFNTIYRVSQIKVYLMHTIL